MHVSIKIHIPVFVYCNKYLSVIITDMEKLSVIVPCYNEEAVLPVFYREVSSVLEKMDIEHELLFVDDGSKDNTLTLMKELAEKDSSVTWLSFSRNFGKEAALYAGLCNASGDYAAVMDADMQDPPSLLPEMLEVLRKGEYDCAAARRSSRTGEPVLRSFLAKCFYKMIRMISETGVQENARDFRMMKKEMTDAVISMGESNRFSKGLFDWVGFRTYWISYENVERAAGNTKWNFWALCRYGLDAIFNFSSTPLTFASWLGLLMTLVSAFFLIFVVVRKLIFGDPVAGWASTICVIIFIGGLQLFCLGIIGQYISRIYLETKQRPHYIISDANRENIQKIR